MSAPHGTARSETSPVTAAEFAACLAAFSPSKSLAVAFSGGPDSLALLILAAQWARRRKGVSLHAFTVDHGLRAASAAEAKQAAALARRLGVPHRTLRWEGIKPASGIQAAARDARYQLLRDACQEVDAGDLLVAHHLEDQAETFLLRLARGSGVDGLAAMPPARRLAEGGSPVRLLRPLLGISQSRLAATIAKSGLVPILDPSNEDDRFDRVRARKALALLAPLGLDAARLARTAGQMARAREALEAEAAALLSTHAVLSPFGHVEMERGPLIAAPPETGLRALAVLIRIVGGADYAPRLDALEAVYAAISEGTLGRGRTLGGVKLALKGHIVLATRETAAAKRAPSFVLKTGEEGLWDGRFHIRIRKAPRGTLLEVHALGEEGLAALRMSDVVLPAVPAAILQTLPGLWREGALVGAPHLGTLGCGVVAAVSLRRMAWLEPSKAPENAEKKGNEPGAGTW
ncbi:tRNA lysidine(34) synthetase TilS [Parvibaculum sp.]|jgi:tRNA(Ile)-lysidine synthase|uniref:tRNA lysidine(34) synthetase TilS n=1 Tax=Parvibaculum sp. TaxID=2024848 RepID=UPI001B01D14D|nr:tRNA lysidine(34) synthetase TilS [Parvibaculum sp.]MBO6634572.1 tRNA lysidine(34) synthetase TilS [Parvibaculum sp.]MBO6679500.1 tRNA lysidine(34) synthetase TilS [Parvibaculum sp.]MBO6684916.1 tRNA lysidine(34) synthetase TilS [Parvibaculum sp.]MBO6906481.1 tRNA lysidine(34) synthetase TilS [Parvibaculum sp.]